jgi:hypothetical protein
MRLAASELRPEAKSLNPIVTRKENHCVVTSDMHLSKGLRRTSNTPAQLADSAEASVWQAHEPPPRPWQLPLPFQPLQRLPRQPAPVAGCARLRRTTPHDNATSWLIGEVGHRSVPNGGVLQPRQQTACTDIFSTDGAQWSSTEWVEGAGVL